MAFNEKAFEIYKKYVEDYENKFVKARRKARAKDWRPIRFASRDYIIGYTVSRYNSLDNVIEVDVFETVDPEWLEGYSGTKVVFLYLLSDAYKCGTSMGIKFTNKVCDGFLPIPLCAMAENTGIVFKYEDKGFITPKESRMLYLKLTGFSQDAIKRIMELSVMNLIAPERICYLVNHGTWTLEEMESIILGSRHPEKLIDGKIGVQNYLEYAEAMINGRLAVMGGILDKKLSLKEVFDEDNFVDVESNEREFVKSFDPRYWIKVYETKEETPIPWTKDDNLIVQSGEKIIVLVRGYEWPDLNNYISKDVEMLTEITKVYGRDKSNHFFLMLCRDISSYTKKTAVKAYLKATKSLGFELMSCPELLEQIDCDVQKRIQQMSVMRNDIFDSEIAETETVKLDWISSYNETQLHFVCMPKATKEGVVVLSELIDKMLYDEIDLKNNVNRIAVEHRYHRTMDKITYLAKINQFKLGNGLLSITGQAMDEILESVQHNLPDNIMSRLNKTVYPHEMLGTIISDLKKYSGNRKEAKKLMSFLKGCSDINSNVVISIDRHQKISELQINTEEENILIEEKFKNQYVLDHIINNEGKNVYAIAKQTMWNAINAYKIGTVNSVNLSELSHMVITSTLNDFLYMDARDFDKPISININYTDGSQARPFPLFRLQRRTEEEMFELRQSQPLEIGMMSCRHTSLDKMVGHYWIRNIEMKMAGQSSAEKDEQAYRITKEKLSHLKKIGKAVRINFYQTGFAPVAIGFYRAVAEFLIENKESKPILEVIPKIYTNSGEYKIPRTTWC